MVEPLAEELSYTPELRDQILSGFRGGVPPLRPAWTYRLALAGVAGAMVLLPVLYVAMVGRCGSIRSRSRCSSPSSPGFVKL